MNSMMYTSDNLFCSNSSPILELSVKFVSQLCHKNINKPLDGAYLADFGIDISEIYRKRALPFVWIESIEFSTLTFNPQIMSIPKSAK